jgi:hypothetical protein
MPSWVKIMFEHIWNEASCGWIVASPDRVPEADALEKGDLYFVWGFLMDPAFIAKLMDRPIPLASAIIRGYRRETTVTDQGRGFRLVPEENGTVMGVVLINPTDEEVEILDHFEQVPTIMIKKRIQVSVGDLTREANIYMKA